MFYYKFRFEILRFVVARIKICSDAMICIVIVIIYNYNINNNNNNIYPIIIV